MRDFIYPDDLSQINEWSGQVFNAPIFPKYGAIVDGVAAGFLVRTDTGYAMLEAFFGNPKASVVSRARAFKRIVSHLLEIAKREGYVMVLGSTGNKAIIDAAVKDGWNIYDTQHTRIYKEL